MVSKRENQCITATSRLGALFMKYNLRHNKRQNHNFRKMKNYMEVEGSRIFFRQRISKTFWNPKFDCKNRVSKRKKQTCVPLTKTKRFLNVWTTLFCNVCQKRLGTKI